jgi:hypothetical protein
MDTGTNNNNTEATMTATTINAITIKTAETLPNGVKVITTDCDDFETFRTLPKAVCFDGFAYGLTAWNSDRNVAYYRTDASVATILGV